MYRSRPALLAGLAFLLLAEVGAAALLPGAEAITDLELSADWRLEIDGEAQSAEIYFSRYEVAYLVRAPGLGSLLISPRGSSVQRLAPEAMVKRGPVAGELPAGSSEGRVTSFKTRGPEESMHFMLDGRHVELKKAPPMLGLQASPAVEKRHPAFAERARTFKTRVLGDPAAPKVARGLDLVVRVYLASSSPLCRRVVPKIMALEQAWSGGGVRFEYYGLPARLVDDPHAVEAGISTVPAVAVYVAGEERTRLIGSQLDRPHQAIVRAFADLGLAVPGRP